MCTGMVQEDPLGITTRVTEDTRQRDVISDALGFVKTVTDFAGVETQLSRNQDGEAPL